jgi:hypothetical protein
MRTRNAKLDVASYYAPPAFPLVSLFHYIVSLKTVSFPLGWDVIYELVNRSIIKCLQIITVELGSTRLFGQ